MPTIFRFVSLLLRRRQSEKAVDRILQWFGRWKKEQQELPAYAVVGKKLLLIRLDDIGDYLLFRNSFALYKNSGRWIGHEIVLLGNSAWKGLFLALDREKADRVIWVDKEEFRHNASYRLSLWIELRKEGFGTVICPSRTRPLLLDDLFVLATGAEQRIATVNTFIHPEWNLLSDSLYTDLFRGDDPLLHEFYFNLRFAGWCCGEAAPGSQETRTPGRRPEIVYPFGKKMTEPYILCFIGSSTKSKRWPVKRWIEFIRLIGGKVVVAGGKQEQKMAGVIQSATEIENIVGKASLVDMIDWVAGAAAVVTNDTMAAHLGPSCNRPTLIIANGTNSLRFTDYAAAGMRNVITVYPRVFLREREKKGDPAAHHMAVSADIASIKAEVVAGKLKGLVG